MEIQQNNTGNFVKAEDWKAVTENGQIIKQIIFKLKDEEARESNSIWDNKEKKFIREGETLTDKDGDVHDFKVILYTSKDMLKEAFPGNPDKEGNPTSYLQKSFKFNRNIIMDNEERTISIGKMANDELIKAMNMTKSFGKDPLQTTYRLCKSGEKINTKYWVEIVPEGEITNDVQQVANQVTNMSEGHRVQEELNNPMPTNPEPITDVERKFVNDWNNGALVFKNGDKVPANKPAFVLAFEERSNNDTPRAEWVYEQLVEIKK